MILFVDIAEGWQISDLTRGFFFGVVFFSLNIQPEKKNSKPARDARSENVAVSERSVVFVEAEPSRRATDNVIAFSSRTHDSS